MDEEIELDDGDEATDEEEEVELDDGDDLDLDDDEDLDLDDGDGMTLNISEELIGAMLGSLQSLVTVHESALDPQMIAEEAYVEAFNDILSFYAKHRKPMSREIYEERHPDLPAAEEYREIEYILYDVRKFAKQHLIGKYEQQIMRSLEENKNKDENLDRVIDLWRSGLSEYGKMFVAQSDRVKAFSREDFLEHYAKKSTGVYEGIGIPFEDMQADINSFEWGHITGIFARPGAKKTFLLAYWLAWVVMTKGLNVLIYSSEMSHTELEERIIAMVAKLNYDSLTKGKLKPEELKLMKKFLKSDAVEELQKHLFVAGPTSVRSLADLEIYCGEKNIKVLGIDNAHTIQAEGSELHDKMNSLMQEMKLMTMRQRMHVIYTTHQNRYGGRGMAGMAYGDAFNTWSSNLLNLNPYKRDDIIEISTPKIRNGRGSMKYTIEFNLYKGSIKSLGKREMTPSAADADDDDDDGEF